MVRLTERVLYVSLVGEEGCIGPLHDEENPMAQSTRSIRRGVGAMQWFRRLCAAGIPSLAKSAARRIVSPAFYIIVWAGAHGGYMQSLFLVCESREGYYAAAEVWRRRQYVFAFGHPCRASCFIFMEKQSPRIFFLYAERKGKNGPRDQVLEAAQVF